MNNRRPGDATFGNVTQPSSTLPTNGRWVDLCTVGSTRHVGLSQYCNYQCGQLYAVRTRARPSHNRCTHVPRVSVCRAASIDRHHFVAVACAGLLCTHQENVLEGNLRWPSLVVSTAAESAPPATCSPKPPPTMHALIELRYYVPPDTKQVISETFFSADLLA